jgi:hypothetical protein
VAREMLEMTREKTKALRMAYDQAINRGVEEFDFEGHILVVGYAGFLLEYLEGKYGEESN